MAFSKSTNKSNSAELGNNAPVSVNITLASSVSASPSEQKLSGGAGSSTSATDIAGTATAGGAPTTGGPMIPSSLIKALQTTSQNAPKSKHEFSVFVSDDGQRYQTTERVMKGEFPEV
jgi:hypothetical protein